MTGPKTVECTPIRNVPAYSSPTSCSRKPAPPTTMMAISSDLTKRMTRDLSYLSESCPDVAENSTNGRMKIAEITNAAVFASTPSNSAVW